MVRHLACLCATAIIIAFTAFPAGATDLTLSWNPVTTDNMGNPLPAGATVSYNLYGAVEGQPLVLLANVTTITNVRSNVNPGTACYAVSAVLVTPATTAGLEGAQTTQVCSTVTSVPTPPAAPVAPAAPANFQIQQTATPAS